MFILIHVEGWCSYWPNKIELYFVCFMNTNHLAKFIVKVCVKCFRIWLAVEWLIPFITLMSFQVFFFDFRRYTTYIALVYSSCGWRTVQQFGVRQTAAFSVGWEDLSFNLCSVSDLLKFLREVLDFVDLSILICKRGLGESLKVTSPHFPSFLTARLRI